MPLDFDPPFEGAVVLLDDAVRLTPHPTRARVSQNPADLEPRDRGGNGKMPWAAMRRPGALPSACGRLEDRVQTVDEDAAGIGTAPSRYGRVAYRPGVIRGRPKR